MKTIAITQARLSSSRLPGKVLQDVGGKTLLRMHLERASRAQGLDHLVLATTNEAGARAIADQARGLEKVSVYHGDLDDVLDRFYRAALPFAPDVVVRLTSDCPLVDPALVDALVDEFHRRGVDYLSNTLNPTFPDGVDVEVFTFASLARAWGQATLRSDREHVTPFIWRNSDVKGGNLFRAHSFESPEGFADLRLTVDEPGDLELVRALVTELGDQRDWRSYADHLRGHPALRALNHHHARNEGLERSLLKDKETP